MSTQEPVRAISDVLIDLEQCLPPERVSIANLLEAFHERGFGFLLLIFSVPMALPIPVPPGINVLLASPLILLTAQQAIGRHTIWLPEGMKKRTIKSSKLQKVINASLPWFKRLEKFVKPRLEFMTRGVFSYLIGVFGLIMALSVCVPLPMTNTVPSLGIALMSVGVIMRDGLVVFVGALVGVLWVIALGAILIFLGSEGIDFVKDMIKGYF